jgi:hypothetical protein
MKQNCVKLTTKKKKEHLKCTVVISKTGTCKLRVGKQMHTKFLLEYFKGRDKLRRKHNIKIDLNEIY